MDPNAIAGMVIQHLQALSDDDFVQVYAMAVSALADEVQRRGLDIEGMLKEELRLRVNENQLSLDDAAE